MCFAFPEHLIVDQPCFTAQQPCVAQRIRLRPGGKVNKLNSASAWVRLGKAVKTNKLPRFKDQAISPKNSVFWFLLSKPKSSSRATCHRIPFSGAELQLSSWGVGGGGVVGMLEYLFMFIPLSSISHAAHFANVPGPCRSVCLRLLSPNQWPPHPTLPTVETKLWFCSDQIPAWHL